MIKVLLVDDHDLVRTGIKRIISDEADIKVVAEASSGEEAINSARELKPQVILMDLKMPGIGGLEATTKILRFNPDIKVIALTTYVGEPFPSRVLNAGAAGYLTKEASAKEMIQAIKDVNSGKRYISPQIAQQLALKHINNDDISPFDALSKRELQVMLMITNGQKVQAISDKLCLSPKTVNSYRYRLFEKLGINSDVELTHLAIRHGIIDTEEA